MTVPAPGWYPDPYRPGMLRWFDGHGWTEHVAPLPAASHHGADPFQSPPTPPGGAATVSSTPRSLPDHVRALIALGALAVVVLVCALGAIVAREFGQAWDRAVVTAQDQRGGAPAGADTPEPESPADVGIVTCDDVRSEIVNHADDYWEQPELRPLTVTNPEVVQDRQLTTDIPAPGEPPVWVLDCRFDATFNAGRTADVWAEVLLYPDGGLEVQVD